jgi:cytochrome c-type biogenesis protein CcmH/NrfF
VSTYGSWILLSPPASGLGSLAWLGPPLLVVGGLGLLLTLVTAWRRRGKLPQREAKAAYLRRVREELAADSTE